MKTFEVHHGDCLEVLRGMPDNSVDSVVTDPPYGLSFMGKKWDYDVPSVEVWAECFRVLKPGGHLLAFAGTRTQHRMAVRIEDAGFEIRDMIAWVYGSGFPKSLAVDKALDGVLGKQSGGFNTAGGKETFDKQDKSFRSDYGYKYTPATEAARQWQGWGTALKPALEPITVARKPLIGTVAGNVLAHGTGGLNIDGCRVGSEAIKIHHAPAGTFAGAEGKTMQSDTYTVTGRWPANLIHDGVEPAELLGDAARFFYCAKASKRDRDEGLDGFSLGNNMRVNGPRESEDAKHATLRANTHPTVKPTDLMRYLCRLVTPPNGIVLDPFTGSGSTGKAAVLEGFQFIGIEREAEYVDIARARIISATLTPEEQQLLF